MIGEFLRRLTKVLRGRRAGDGERVSGAAPGERLAEPARSRAGEPSPLTLAYVGDAVYELYVRVHLVEREGMTRNFQPAATGLVRASVQSRILGALEPHLTEEELNVVRQGRNANIGQIPKSASMIDYRRATAFECLLGHLLLKGQEERLMELLPLAVAEGRKPAGELAEPGVQAR
jgi:ribonuclease III family protein